MKGDSDMKTTEFIEKIAPAAVADFKTSKVLPSLTIAQAIIESAWGESGLTQKANNLIGIKGKGSLSIV
jgi:flagellum-specific peptidoglycan hydrolase FlgJ